MNKAMTISSFVGLSLLLSAWSFTTPLEWLYYDRTKFTLLSEDGESQRTFLCVKGKTEGETKIRANAANAYYEKENEQIANEYSENLMNKLLKSGGDDEDDGDEKKAFIMDAVSANLVLQKEVTQLIAKIEKSYQCNIIDINNNVDVTHE